MKLSLIDKKHETGNIWSFLFDIPEGTSWQAGQSIRLEVPRSTWGYDERRFTISSLPSSGHLQITTRVSSSEFKTNLGDLKPGDQIDGYNIEGRLNWGSASQPKVFIAGGTGITLFHVALLQALSDKKIPSIDLFYSARDKPLLFEEELKQWQAEYPEFKLHLSNRRFDAKEISSAAPKLNDSLIHIAGPSKMVGDLKNQLLENGLKPASLNSEFLS